MKWFTGIGATSITPDEGVFIEELGYELTKRGYSLRSGKAPGSDQRFQAGVEKAMSENDYIRDHQVFLPWRRFEESAPFVTGAFDIWNYTPEEITGAEAIAARIHPVWNDLTQGQRKFHMRNVFQPLGLDLKSPSSVLIACSDSDSNNHPRGGTRTAYLVALENDIPCINIRGLGREIVMDWINKYCPVIEGME